MSEIPIGSPPAPPGRHAAPQGWYPDPVDRARERYWDGWSWTRNTRGSESTTQSGQPTGPASTGQQPPQQSLPHGPYAGPPPATAGRSGAQTADGVPLAAWGWRLLAGILDLIVVGIVSTMAALPFFLEAVGVATDFWAETWAAVERGEPAPTPPTATELMSTRDQMWVALISAGVGLLYFALFWRFKRATPGQLLCGLRIVPYGQGRSTERLGWSAVIIRSMLWWVPFAVSSLLLIFGLINALSPLWNPNRQAIHDLAARTQVIKIN